MRMMQRILGASGLVMILVLAFTNQVNGAVLSMEDIVYNEQEISLEASFESIQEEWLEELEDFDTAEIQDFLNSLHTGYKAEISFHDVMKELAAGNLMGVFEASAEMIQSTLFTELHTNTTLMGQMIVLAVIGAVFSGLSGIFSSGQVSDTGFYVVYLLAMAFLAASFFSSVTIASDVVGELLGFMKVLLPAYFLAVAMSGSAITSAAICGFTLGVIGLMQSVFSQILIPATRIFMMLVLAGNLYKEDMISKLTELLEHAILWTCRTLFGAVVGFHVIQGMILPQADALKNASAMRLVQMVPGLGGGVGAVSQMVLGSGILIKNTAGMAAVVILLLLAAVPMVKLLILTVLYYVAAAAMQPVCDKRLAACMTGAAVGHSLLVKMVGYSLALFAATIAVICVTTNVSWYAG